MPTLGTPENDSRGIAIIPVPSEEAIQQFHRKKEEQRMAVPEELEAIVETSERTRVYIYSVGAWPQQLDAGSLGSRWISSLTEDRVLQPNDLSVSTPLVVPGIPSEPYPNGDEGKRIYHTPKKRDPLRRHTGYHQALEFIGAAGQSKKSNDLRPFGVFVSLQPEQPKPGKNADEATLKAFAQWKSDVNAAQKALRTNYSAKCAAATEAWKRGSFGKEYMNDERIFVIARILKKTRLDCPWLENTEASNENKNCIAECGAVLPIGAIRCGQCGEKQVSDEKYEKIMKERRELT